MKIKTTLDSMEFFSEGPGPRHASRVYGSGDRPQGFTLVSEILILILVAIELYIKQCYKA